jgi:hypothetical protein
MINGEGITWLAGERYLAGQDPITGFEIHDLSDLLR